jgi:putative dehydrogenase
MKGATRMETNRKGSVGVIGLGAMGLGVARSLLRAGFPTYAFDVRPEVLASFTAEGGHASSSPATLGSVVSVLIVLVVNAQQTESVLFGDDGATSTMAEGSVVVTSATVPPGAARSFGERLNAMGLLHIDGPVSGGPARAADGQMTIMASGSAEAFARCDAVFAAISTKVYRLGQESGAGSRVKMINQLLAGVHIAAAAEAIALGIQAGANPEELYEVICNSAGSSWMFQNRVPHILEGDFTPLSAVNIFVKDLGIVLNAAHESKFPLPLTAAAHQMFLMAAAAGHGNEDDSAVIKIFPGISLPEAKERSI